MKAASHRQYVNEWMWCVHSNLNTGLSTPDLKAWSNNLFIFLYWSIFCCHNKTLVGGGALWREELYSAYSSGGSGGRCCLYLVLTVAEHGRWHHVECERETVLLVRQEATGGHSCSFYDNLLPQELSGVLWELLPVPCEDTLPYLNYLVPHPTSWRFHHLPAFSYLGPSVQHLGETSKL
jgi:hypothetical protein